jgi:hypothetical protein
VDLSKAIAFNGHTASGVSHTPAGASYGVNIEEAQFSDAEVVGYLDKAALRDGIDAGDVYLGRRVLNIRAAVLGSSKGDGFDRLQGFLAAYSPRLAYNADTANLGFRPLTFYQPTADIVTWPASAYTNGIPMQFYCRPAALPAWRVVRDATGGAASNGIAFDVRVPLLMRDPRKYLQTEVSVSVSTATSTATYRGDYPTWGTVIIAKSSASAAANFTMYLGGETTVVDFSTSTGTSYTLDYGARTFYLTSTGASRMSWVANGINGREVATGRTYRMANTTGITSATLTYREAWA